MGGRKPYIENSWECLIERLYERDLQDGFSEDLVSLKTVLPCLRSLDHLKDLLESLARAGNRKDDEELMSDLNKLNKTSYHKTPLMNCEEHKSVPNEVAPRRRNIGIPMCDPQRVAPFGKGKPVGQAGVPSAQSEQGARRANLTYERG